MKYRSLFAIAIALTAFALAKTAHAAILTVSSNTEKIYTGDQVELKLNLNTENQEINAGELYIELPKSLKVTKVKSAGSIFTLWVNEPSGQGTQASFIGGVPFPGFKGESGYIGSIIVEATKTSKELITLDPKSQILLSDGEGTKTTLTLNNAELKIESPPKNYTPKKYTEESDITPPHDLKITIGKSETEFEGQWFASWNAQDDESGINKYEIAELEENQKEPSDTDWKETKSPYVLKNQNKNITLYVKAIDNAGNFTVNKIEHKASHTNLFRLAFLIAGIIILLIAIILKRKTKKHAPLSKSSSKK